MEIKYYYGTSAATRAVLFSTTRVFYLGCKTETNTVVRIGLLEILYKELGIHKSMKPWS